jgi:SAM-dependent methyltransferase
MLTDCPGSVGETANDGGNLPDQASAVYSPAFFDELTHGTRESAQIIVSAVNDLLRPGSVLDVGCGTATWLSEWSRAGVEDVVGMDGDYVDRAALQLPAGKFVPADLGQPFSLGRKFDLVQSLEVAEHLDEACADTFVESLARHGDTIMFSAAIPGQGGTHHVNEQWPSYWAEKFAKAGYDVYDVIRPQIWTNPHVAWWYRQNILLFARGRAFESTTARLDLVHPEMWRDPAQLLRSVPEALTKLLLRKFGIQRPGA